LKNQLTPQGESWFRSCHHQRLVIKFTVYLKTLTVYITRFSITPISIQMYPIHTTPTPSVINSYLHSFRCAVVIQELYTRKNVTRYICALHGSPIAYSLFNILLCSDVPSRSVWLCKFLLHQRAFRLSPWCKCDLCSSGILRTVDW
jgi:hypothetical protein